MYKEKEEGVITKGGHLNASYNLLKSNTLRGVSGSVKKVPEILKFF